MKKLTLYSLLFPLLLVALPFLSGLAKSSMTPVGTYTTIDDQTGKQRSIMQINERGGVYSATILKVFKQKGDTGICTKCPGHFKNKKIQGLTIMWGVRKTGENEWSGGQILDPKSGKIYRVMFSMGPGGKTLKVRGYLGVSLFGRTQVWHRR